MTNADDNDGDEPTRVGTPEERALEEAADAIRRAANVVEENLRLVRTLPEDRRGSVIRACSILLGELGDLAHEQRRILIRMTGIFYLF